jgi:hypothetical protein
MARMGNVLRVLGIIVASMLLALVGLFLLLFSICGGLQSSEGAGILAICLVLLAGCAGLIVFLGRGLAAGRTAARGLAVPPASMPAAPAAPGFVVPLHQLTGTDLQALIGLRACLAIYVLVSLGSMLFTITSVGRYGGAVVIQLVLRSLLGILPPAALLIAVSVRNPPAPLALDAAACSASAISLLPAPSSPPSTRPVSCPRCSRAWSASARSKRPRPASPCTCAAASPR